MWANGEVDEAIWDPDQSKECTKGPSSPFRRSRLWQRSRRWRSQRGAPPGTGTRPIAHLAESKGDRGGERGALIHVEVMHWVHSCGSYALGSWGERHYIHRKMYHRGYLSPTPYGHTRRCAQHAFEHANMRTPSGEPIHSTHPQEISGLAPCHPALFTRKGRRIEGLLHQRECY